MNVKTLEMTSPSKKEQSLKKKGSFPREVREFLFFRRDKQQNSLPYLSSINVPKEHNLHCHYGITNHKRYDTVTLEENVLQLKAPFAKRQNIFINK